MFRCGTCRKTFSNEFELDVHRDTCDDDLLFCRVCGERFAERRATRDGWSYRCTTDGCEGEGIGEDLFRIEDVRMRKRV